MKRVPRRLLIVPAATTLLAAAFGLILPANAQTFSSSYTSSAPKDCRTIGKPEDSNGSTTQVCPGKSGLVVLISVDDLRETVSVGPNHAAAAKEPAAETWFAPFNSTAHTVEWRAVDGRPFAIIQRWLIADNNALDKTGSPTTKPMLAVTRLPPGPVCHVAYIDGQANRNPNELARQAADEFARDFNCGKDEVKVIGEKGAAVSLAKR
ncbi:hypothetical protein [Bradyrhizobium valentinum]|uniref:Uncharacterized protein n=1 Tax=Bradyrhizobium valentinum TaxID=1518501 RepID=A0A0R3KVP6_9BRAD|nr:hypothetical protein [Bradyrhizobium valentinum]KRQ99575.1 hypothetical protein CP49_40890 [Bradyrhizobium valentinum]